MKAIILAAGKGTRFGERTKITPKPLIQINNLSLLEHNISLLKKNNIKEVIINVSYKSDEIIERIGNGENYNISIEYSIEKPEPLETGGGIYNTLKFFNNEPFYVVNSDTYSDINLSKIKLEKNDLAALVMTKNPRHNTEGDFFLDNGRINLEKGVSMTYTGISILNPKIFSNFSHGTYKLYDVLIKAIKINQVSGIVHEGLWFDIGNEERLQYAIDTLK
mgnify:CR=1 FL=1|tara:strand:- start:7110 stop:7769 length:660 start_codon:yes stop_codon:yes gene_type:complete